MHARWSAALLCALDVGVLAGVRPHPAELIRRLDAPRGWLEQSPDAALAALSGTLLWLLAAELGVGIATTLLARVPGTLGRWSATASRRLLPGGVRRIVAGSVGLGVLLAPLPAVLGCGPAASATSASTAALPSPVWPGTDVASPSNPPRDAPSNPPPHDASAPPLPAPVRAADRPVVVRPGDCLWLIAARRLGAGADSAEVAAAWPRWYAANRDLIGADPGLIRPGERLIPPDAPTRP